jgi:glycosyltransferase involved in cell wall biosynthesis
MLRRFYNAFDGIFVLNSDQAKWLSGNEMNIAPEKIHLTSHWADTRFYPRPVEKSSVHPKLKNVGHVLLYVGRLSDEKGVMELPEILKGVLQKCPDSQMVIAGTGPSEKKLKEEMPNAVFTGWVDTERLAQLYSVADMLVFPSRFDTFGNSVLEALSSGVPAVAYNTKGPKDIIEHNKSGFLIENIEELILNIAETFNNDVALNKMRLHAINRSKKFSKKNILNKMAEDLNLNFKVEDTRKSESYYSENESHLDNLKKTKQAV